MFAFNSFQLDVANASLRRGKQPIVLAPKAFNVLRYLVEHAGQLVTKDELWRAVWPEVSVTDAALTVCVSELRKALSDDSRTPRYIETVHRLGYRFIAPVEPLQPTDTVINHQAPALINRVRSANPNFVGREAELGQLHEWLGRALTGERQIVFVTGEAGIGKTTLVEQFLLQAQLATKGRLWLGRGQCIEYYGAGEAYLPVLDALGRLCREPQARRLVAILDQHAPVWLAQMPALLEGGRWKELQSRVAGATRERMLRELADAVEVISQEQLLVLQLEDLHWSDHSTLEWLGFLARRQEPARLLVLATYRPVEVIVREHPLKNLKQELQVHRQCQELALSLLSEAAVTEYLNVRLAAPGSPSQSNGEHWGKASGPQTLPDLAHTIYQRTDGNPLFMVNVVDYLLERGVLKTVGDASAARSADAIAAVDVDAPPSIIEMIERNLERLNPEEQAVLEAASVAGAEFPAVAVAAALDRPINEIESCCARLSRRQHFVRVHSTEEWPDGTVAATFQFLHGLYRDVLYDRVPPGRRLEVHRRVAERKETAWGERAGEIATELAYHYRRAGKIEQTICYLERAVKQAMRRSAYTEALDNCQQALVLLNRQPQSSNLLRESPERDARELQLLQSLYSTLYATRGWAAPETVAAAERVRILAEKRGNLRQLIGSMLRRSAQSLFAGELRMAGTLADQALELAQRERSATMLARVHEIQLVIRFHRGDLAGVEKHFAAGLEFFDDLAFRRAPTADRINVFSNAAYCACITGRVNAARERITNAAAAVNPTSPYERSYAEVSVAFVHTFIRENEEAEIAAARALELCEKHKITSEAAFARCLLGHARAQLGRPADGIELIRRGITELLDTGLRLTLSGCTTLLAIAQQRAGALDDALETAEKALEVIHEDPVHRPNTLMVRGELRLAKGQSELAEADFHHSIKLAKSMGAKAYELRTAISWARLLVSQGRANEARAILAEIYNWFTEGFDTADLREAKALLEELGTAERDQRR
jgi:predicted ATPase/DNA-binding winged helix-turn-helix (wHTH) protein